MTQFGDVNVNTNLSRQYIIPLSSFRKGTTAPTDQTQGTTPTIPTLRFTAVADTASTAFVSPQDIDVTIDGNWIFDFALTGVETTADTLDITVDYIVVEDEANNNSLLKTATQVTGSATVTTANGLAAGDTYRVTIPISSTDATNPFANMRVIGLELHLTNITGVGSADLVGARFGYEAIY